MIGGLLASTWCRVYWRYRRWFSSRLQRQGHQPLGALLRSLEALKPILIILQLLASLFTGLVMIYVVGQPVAGLLAGLTRAFSRQHGHHQCDSAQVLLGGMMCGPGRADQQGCRVCVLGRFVGVAELCTDGGDHGSRYGAPVSLEHCQFHRSAQICLEVGMRRRVKAALCWACALSQRARFRLPLKTRCG